MHSQFPSRSALGQLWGPLSAPTLRRQELSAHKARCYADDFLGLVTDRIGDRYRNAGRRAEMRKFASTTVNVAKSITDACAVNYALGVRRTIADADERLSGAWADLVAESGAEREQAAWGASSWLCGPTLVIPHVDAATNELQLTAVRPDEYDAKLGPGRTLTAVLWRCDEADQWVYITPDVWRYFDADGKPARSDAPHALGYVPAAVMRSVPELFGGFWGAATGRGLLDASLDAAIVYAQMQWYRTVQVGYLTTMIGNNEKFGAGQSLAEPELPVTADAAPGEASVSVLSRDVDVDRFVRHIAAIFSYQIQQHGVPANEVTFQQNADSWGALAMSIRSEKLAALRARQVVQLLKGERDLWTMVADVVARSGHRLAGEMRPRDEMKRRIVVEFAEIEGTMDPQQRLQLFQAELAEGFTNRVEYYQARHPTLSDDACRKRIEQNRADHFHDIEEAASRNISFDPAKGLQSIAQRQGALGGQTRAANAQETGT